MKKLICTLLAFIFLVSGMTIVSAVSETEELLTIYVDSSLESAGNGLTPENAVKTLTAALGKFSVGKTGNIIIIGEYDASSSGFSDISNRGKVTIGGYDENSAILHGALDWTFLADTVFDDIEIRMVASGYKYIGAKSASLEFGTGVEFTQANGISAKFQIAGVPWMNKALPPESNRVTHTKLVMRNANSSVSRVYGGSCQNTYSAVRVTNDTVLEIHGGTYPSAVYGTGQRATVDASGYYHDIIIDGNLFMTVTGGTFSNTLAALGNGYSTVKGNAITEISGGSFAGGKTIYISSETATSGYYIGGDAVMEISGGTFANGVIIGKAAADNIYGKEVYLYQNGLYDTLSAGGVSFGYASRLSSDADLIELKAESGLEVEFNTESNKISVDLEEGKALYIDGVEQAVSKDGLYTVTGGSHILTVGVSTENSITITLDINCEDESVATPAPVIAKPGNAAELPDGDKVVRKGYTLLGWSNDKDAQSGAFTYNTDVDTTLYAIWQEKPVYTIYFDDNLGGQSMNIDPITAYEGETVTLPVISGLKPGKRTFNGWAETNSSTSGVYTYTVTKSRTLYGTWKVLEDITVPASDWVYRVSGYGDSCTIELCELDGKQVSKLTPNPESAVTTSSSLTYDGWILARYSGIDVKYYKYVVVNYFYDAGEQTCSPRMEMRFLNPNGGTRFAEIESGKWTSAIFSMPTYSSLEDSNLKQIHFTPFSGVTPQASDATEGFYLESITFTVEMPTLPYDEIVYAENPPANTRIIVSDTMESDGFERVSQAVSEYADVTYAASFDASLRDIESGEAAAYGEAPVTLTVEKEYFGDTDLTELCAYLVSTDGDVELLSHSLTDTAVLVKLYCDGEVIFVHRDTSLPEVAVEYRYDVETGKFLAGIYVKSGILEGAKLGFAFDSSLLTYVGAVPCEGFALNSSCEDGRVTASFVGSTDASRMAVHIGDIEFALAGEYDKTALYLENLVPDDADGVSKGGFYLGTDGDGLETAVNMGVPGEYEYPYGYIEASLGIQRAEGDSPLLTSPLKLALYYEDGALVEGFPVTVDETAEFIVQIPNGEYTAVITKNGYLAKIIEQIPINGGNITDLGEITMIPGDIVNSADDDSGDGIVDIDDFVRILRAFSEKLPDSVKALFDINEDGNNTVADIALVKTNLGKRAEQTTEIYGMPKPDYFNNIYTRLIKDKELTIGYMGGSITDGTVGGTTSVRWRTQTTNWFKKNFPEATITEIGASLGGTDTYLASFRMDKVLLEKATPDLVFIEYASNDYHEGNNYRSSARQLESIFLKLRRANPNVNIIVIFSFRDFGYGNPYVTQAVRGMWTMADYYGVMVLPLGYEAYEKYKDTWYVKDSSGAVLPQSFTNDGIHLTEFGHNFYAGRICSVIGDEILAKVSGRVVETEFAPQKMPEKFHSNTLENSYMVLEMEDYLTENTTFIPNTGGFSWATDHFPHSYIGSYGHDSNTGDIFEFKFTGTEVGIVYAMMNDNAYIRYRVDGGKWYRPTLKISGGNGSNPKVYRLFQGLDESEHTVTIEVLGTKPSDSSGYNFRIGALLINPDPSVYSEELDSPSLLRPDGTYEDISGLADNDPAKTEWDSYGIIEG